MDSCNCKTKRHSQIWTTFLILLLATCLSNPQSALAKRKSIPPTAATSTKPSKVKHQRSSTEETTAARDRRLHRECKGRPNAGACLGYAKP